MSTQGVAVFIFSPDTIVTSYFIIGETLLRLVRLWSITTNEQDAYRRPNAQLLVLLKVDIVDWTQQHCNDSSEAATTATAQLEPAEMTVEQLDAIAVEVTTMSRDELVRRLCEMNQHLPFDFNPQGLAVYSDDRLRHILLGAYMHQLHRAVHT